MSEPLITAPMRKKILDVLQERYGTMTSGEGFTVSGESHGDSTSARIVLANNERTLVHTMTAAIDRSVYKAMSAHDAVTICLDFLEWYLGEYFRSQRELLLPLDWQPHRFGDVSVMAKAELRNEFLDNAADAWLRGERTDVSGEWKKRRRKR